MFHKNEYALKRLFYCELLMKPQSFITFLV